ncbi:arylsulfatase [Verrucomicrobiaceae bacterium N1E253]|uniref:Arylsulfatase n=1 Tax=Oceaniferula marina TaxID=2748318 RepID=A0A851GCZ6_9BACT|nr:arylsulfatase [Oceaniferula marina]NWK55296.1 arylsulfatase [Oceaniferula marina]
MTRHLLTLASSALFALGSAIAADKPNIIYILLDDAGYGDFSCYGQEKFQTPNIDKLATEGMQFTDHYSGSTVCAPTRSVLMTGLHTGHTPIRGNSEVKPVGQKPLPADTLTIAKLLKQHGYATGAFGKWGLGYPGSEGDPLNQGFDRFYGYNCQRNAHTYYPTWLYDDKTKITLDGKTYSHTLIMDECLAWIKEQGSDKKAPFFCYLPITIPHAAMHVPEKYAAPFRKKFPQFENKIGRYAGPNVRNPAAMFAGMMTLLDEDIGRLMSLIKDLGIDDNTVVMFTSDNGAHREGGHMPDFFNSNGGMRGHKRALSEGGIRTPLLVRWPGTIKAGSKSEHISAHWDVFPTLCEISGTETPGGLDGISYLPELLGKPQKKHAYLYWEFMEQGGKRALRFGKDGQWKAIQLKASKNKDAPIALYNLKKDPREEKDVSKQHPELIDTVKKTFDKARTTNDTFKFNWEKK